MTVLLAQPPAAVAVRPCREVVHGHQESTRGAHGDLRQRAQEPVAIGDFYHFSGPASPFNQGDPYMGCNRDSGHGGNP